MHPSPPAPAPAPPPQKKIQLRAMLEKQKLEKDGAMMNVPLPSRRDPPAPAKRMPPPVPQLVPARWPPHIIHLADNFNPDDIRFPDVPTHGLCGCLENGDCWYGTCSNASYGIFCDVYSCPWSGNCSNGTRQSDSVRLMRVKKTDILTVQAISRINEGVVIGEYLGELSMQPGDRTKREKNEGYRLHFHTDQDTWDAQQVCVNALHGGTLMRFVNHSCTPNAIFNEVGNGTRRTITVVSKRIIRAGEEILIDYGDWWFTCRCAPCEQERRPRRQPVLKTGRLCCDNDERVD